MPTLPKILLLDNFDSFTYILNDYLLVEGANTVIYRNNVDLAVITAQQWDGIVLSPGPGRPENAGILMDVIKHYAGKVPILGVCLGHQAIGLYFGADVISAIKPMHGKISAVNNIGKGVFIGLPAKFNVVRYHSLVIGNLPPELECTAITAENEIMGIIHHALPIEGLQFHPEAVLTENGKPLIRNWLAVVKSFGNLEQAQ